MRLTMYRIVQYEKNNKTGESLNFDEETIKRALEKLHPVRYAYIRHDKDAETPHWHIGIMLNADARLPWVIADAFELKPGMVGKLVRTIFQRDGETQDEAWKEYCRYLVHDQNMKSTKGKHPYDHSEVKCNFDYDSEIYGKEGK